MEAAGTWSTGPPCHWSLFRPCMMLWTAEMNKLNLGGERGDCPLLVRVHKGLGTSGFLIRIFWI